MADTYTTAHSSDEGFNLDADKIRKLVTGLATDPKNNWPVYKNEYGSIKSLYLNYILPLLGLRAVVEIIRATVIGTPAPIVGTIRSPLGPALFTALVEGLFLAGILYIAAFAFTKLAPTFKGETDLLRALRLAAFPMGITCIASVAMLIPWLGDFLVLLVSLYCIYVMYNGVGVMTTVPEIDRLKYMVVSCLAVMVSALVLGIFFSPMMHRGYVGSEFIGQ